MESLEKEVENTTIERRANWKDFIPYIGLIRAFQGRIKRSENYINLVFWTQIAEFGLIAYGLYEYIFRGPKY